MLLLSWLANKYGGKITLFDLFGRIPPPTLADGQEAMQRYEKIIRNEDGEAYYGNLQDLRSIIARELKELIKLEQINFVPGKYEDTLPERISNECFHLVHVDCDWYESTRAVLEYLNGRLQPGAILQFDDYGFWSGSKKAVDAAEWLRGYFWENIDEALLLDLGRRADGSPITARTGPQS